MNIKDRTRLNTVVGEVNDLLDAGQTGSGILNIDVLEALLGDITSIVCDRDPQHVHALIERDRNHDRTV